VVKGNVKVGIDNSVSPEKLSIGVTSDVVLTKNFSAIGLKDFADLSKSDTLLLKFVDIDGVASEVLRDFVKWLMDIEVKFPNLIIRLENLPSHVARQLIPMRNYLPQKLEVLSMFVPFYCENCDNEDRSYLVTSQQARAARNLGDLLGGPLLCKKCDTNMEPEVVADKYLNVMLDRASW
jgi:hypothetical protein